MSKEERTMTASDTCECGYIYGRGYDHIVPCKSYGLARMLNEEYKKQIIKIFEEEQK